MYFFNFGDCLSTLKLNKTTLKLNNFLVYNKCESFIVTLFRTKTVAVTYDYFINVWKSKFKSDAML